MGGCRWSSSNWPHPQAPAPGLSMAVFVPGSDSDVVHHVAAWPAGNKDPALPQAGGRGRARDHVGGRRGAWPCCSPPGRHHLLRTPAFLSGSWCCSSCSLTVSSAPRQPFQQAQCPLPWVTLATLAPKGGAPGLGPEARLTCAGGGGRGDMGVTGLGSWVGVGYSRITQKACVRDAMACTGPGTQELLVQVKALAE